LGDERARHREHLSFTTGQLGGVLLSSLSQDGELFVLFVERRLQRGFLNHCTESQIFFYGEFANDAATFGHVTNSQARNILGPLAH
jgi:hypothetical protein